MNDPKLRASLVSLVVGAPTIVLLVCSRCKTIVEQQPEECAGKHLGDEMSSEGREIIRRFRSSGKRTHHQYTALLRVVLFTLAVLIAASEPLQAQTFAPIPALHFVKPFAGANPLPQMPTVISVGAAFDFRVTSATTTAGGAWLSVTGCGSYCNTPQVLTVSVNAEATLAAGSYTGQIVLTEYYGRTSITVPVTLTVAAPGTTFFDNLAGQMSFSLAAGGSTPPAQTIQVRNGGSGTLNWTLAMTTADGGNWLSASAASGTAPAYVTVTLQKQNLPGAGQVAGTYIGQLAFTSASGKITVPVRVSVGSDSFRQVNPINFTKRFAGANPLPQILTIASVAVNFDFRVTSSTATGGDWLAVTGCGAYCNTPQAITATVNAASALPAGIYTGQIVITEYYGSRSLTIPVTLTVTQAGSTFFDDVPGDVSFSFNVPAPNTPVSPPPDQSIGIANGGSGSLNWTVTASTSDGGNWLTASPSSGTAPSRVSVGLVVANLPSGGLVAGTYVGQLIFDAPGSRVTVPVSVVVGPSAFRQVNAISFVKPFGGANPLPQTLPIATASTAVTFRVTSMTANGGEWLSVSGCGAYCDTPQVITATVNAETTLPAGTYTAQIVVTEYYGSMSMTIPVTLTVAGGGTSLFDNLPGQLSFTHKTGPGNPESQSLQIRNAGSGGLSWTASVSTSDGGNWLNISALSGSAPSSVTVGITASALPGGGLVAGNFNGEVVFRSSDGSSVTVPVSVTVAASVFSQLSGLTFTKAYGGTNPLSQTLNVTSTGTNMTFRVAKATGNGGDWLTVTGCGAYCGTPKTITVAVNPSQTLAAGTYTGQVVMSEYYSSMSMTVPVTLVVGTTPATPAATTASPSTGSGTTQTFTATYSDGNGAADISVVYFLVNSTLDGSNACFIEYNRAANSFRLMNDAGTTWSTSVSAGSGSTSNSQCTLNGSGAAGTASGNSLSMMISLAFQESFSGAKNLYGLAIDSGNISSGWKALGSWTIPSSATPPTPGLVSLSPVSGGGTSGTFTAVFRHGGGQPQHYLGYLLFLPTPNIVWFTAQGSCLIEYNRISNGMRLITDSGTAWLGPPQGVPVAPTTPPLSNNACTVNVAGANASFSGTEMTVTVPVVFKSAGLTGVLGTFTQELDVNGQWTDMRQFGNWVLPGAPIKSGPAVVGLTPTQTAGNSATFTATGSHTAGVAQIGLFHLLIADRVVGGAACQIVYFAFDDTVALINDAGTDFAGAGRVPRGSANTLANSRCSVNVAAMTRSVAGNNVSVSYPLTFNTSTFGGAKNVYLNTFDLSGNLSHWVQGGSITIQ